MFLQAALNGPLSRTDHPAVPLTPEELAHDAAACVAAGARAVHLHPRDEDGREALDPVLVDEVVRHVRAACGVTVGVSTGAWIEPDLERRVACVAAWTEPAYASVNLSEPGAGEVMRALLDAGVGIEAGVWSVEDAERLAATGLGGRVTRILVEPPDLPAGSAIATIDRIHRALDAAGVMTPRLQHGDGAATWPLLEDAVLRGIDTRVGLEDTRQLPGGERCADNVDLVRAAARVLGRRR